MYILVVMCFGPLNVVYVFGCMVYVVGGRGEGVGD